MFYFFLNNSDKNKNALRISTVYVKTKYFSLVVLKKGNNLSAKGFSSEESVILHVQK